MDGLKTIKQLFEETIESLDSGSWRNFLETAAWNYKYDFADQLLIYAQKPDATAVATADFWKHRLQRPVKKDSMQIALLDDSGDMLSLKYVVDVSDTEGEGPVPQWRMTRDSADEVCKALSSQFLQGTSHSEGGSDFFYRAVAGTIVASKLKEASEALGTAGIDETDRTFRSFLRDSVTVVIMRRLGLEPKYISKKSFEFINKYSTIEALSLIGQMTRESAYEALYIANQVVLNREKAHSKEEEYESELSERRRLPDSGINNGRSDASEPLRENEKAVSEREQTLRIPEANSERRAAEPSADHRGEDQNAGGRTDSGTADSDAGTGEENQQPGVDTAYDETSEHSGRRDSEGDNLHLIDSEEPESSDEPPLESYLKGDLLLGSGFHNGKFRIYEQFGKAEGSKANIAFLKNEYGMGGRTVSLSAHVHQDHDAKGITISNYEDKVLFKWPEIERRIADLIKLDVYLTSEEKIKFEAWKEEQAAKVNAFSQPDSPAPDVSEFSFSEPTLFDFMNPDDDDILKQEAESLELNELLNYHNADLDPHYGGPKQRFRNNVAAIKLLKELEAEERLATAEEQEVLARYVGWGGLQEAFDANNISWANEYTELRNLLTDDEYDSARESTLTAFYTPPVVTDAIFSAIKAFGFEKGNILDPCCGTGNFFGSIPPSMSESKLYGVELDSISGRIGRQLYQKADILIDGYENTNLSDSFFDVAVGNVPFGTFKLPDRRYDKENFLIHDYFFAKTLDKVRPGGIIAFITSKGTMDKANDSVRRYISQRADLLGAIRLPNTTFKENAGTEAVADIIFLQKRRMPQLSEPSWVGLEYMELADEGDDTFKRGPAVNAYFAEHPEMVLGELKEVSGPYGPEITCMPREGENLGEALKKAIGNIEGSFEARMEEWEEEAAESEKVLPADPSVRNFSYTLVDDDIYFREDSKMYQVEVTGIREQRLKGMIELRDITRDLIDAQLEGAPDETVALLQKKLNDTYDIFTEKYGLLNSRGNGNVFSDDSSYYLLCSLEHVDDKGEFLGKADIFFKRTIGVHAVPTHVETAQEALAICVGEFGKIDLDYMSELTDLKKEHLIEELRGSIFPSPGLSGQYLMSSTYLSGNVREKLKEAVSAFGNDPKFESNVEFLEKAIPEDLPPESISVRLGSTWIPEKYVTEFMHGLLDTPYWAKEKIEALYEPVTDTWTISNKNWDGYNSKANSTYGTRRANAYRLIEDALNQKNTQIYDTVETADGKTRRVLNANDTIEAREKQEQIKEKFKEWLWSDSERCERLCRIYNDKFNSIVPPQYDGNLVRFHNMNPLISLEDHQKEAVARILYGGNTQLAHVVGAGKTWSMVAAAMEGKYLGLCNKSLIVVPNHLVGQWASAIYELYPAAKVLASTKKDFEKKNRKKFCSRIATGDYDVVVIGHSQFERIPLSQERQEKNLKEQIEDIENSIVELKMSRENRSYTVKQMEAMKKTLNNRLTKLKDAKQRDDVVTFEELGVDRLFVDESHEYKNLFLYTKMQNVAGISQTDSQKASDLFMKCRYIDEITGNMGNIHATGTPLSNTMAELYTTQRYLQYDELQKMGLGSFDAWASTFGETVQSLELAPEGSGYRERTRFAKFFNIPELMSLYKQVADIRTSDMLKLPVPEVEYHTDVLMPSAEQKEVVKELGERADKIRGGKVERNEDNMLCITNDGRKLALDQRLIKPELPDNPHSKAAACADNILHYYIEGNDEKLTQLVFCDLSTPKPGEFSVYEDLKEKLIARGIPEDEIRFIHEANTDAQKEALFEQVRNGEVRVLMGSTGKMGTGTNVQDRLIAGHDLDCPWRPSDLEQRAGRVVRRGNRNKLVHMHRYVTKGTFDAYLYQLIETKQRFASQIMTSKSPVRVANDVDESVLNYSQIKALASDNPKIREKIELEIEVARLETLETRYRVEQSRLLALQKKLPGEIEEIKERIQGLEADAKVAESNPRRAEDGELAAAVILDKTYSSQEETGKQILAIAKKIPEPGKWYKLGSLRGFELRILKPDGKMYSEPQIAVAGARSYRIDCGAGGSGLMVRLNNVLDNVIPERIEKSKLELFKLQHQLEGVNSEYGKPFVNGEELKEKKLRLAELEKELNLDAMKKEETVEEGTASIEAESLDSMIYKANIRSDLQSDIVGKTQKMGFRR